MTSNFNEAVEAIALLSKNYVKNGQIVLPPCEPETFTLQTELGIPFDGFGDNLEQTENHELHYYCSDLAAETLLEVCEVSTAAFDLCTRIAAHGLIVDQALPPALQKFAGWYLAGLIKRPKGTRRSKQWLRNIYLLTLVRVAHKQFGLTMTRNDDGHNEKSACDAVSKGLEKNGHSTTPRSIKELCVGSKKEQKQIRSEFNDWVIALSNGLESGEISERQVEQTWLWPAIM